MRITAQDWLQAQHSVLGAALIDEKAAVRILTETEERDYTGSCKTVFHAMRSLFLQGKPLDPVTVGACLGADYRDFLVQLMNICPTTANVDHYIQLCREQARILSVQDIANQLAQAETVDQVRQLLEQANGCMMSKQNRRPVTMADALASFMERHTREATYLSWPIREFNDHLYSEPGDFIIFGAEPSVGKTAFALQCAWHWAQDIKVGFFSFETSAAKLFDRKMASIAGLHMQAIKNNNLRQEDWDRICSTTQEITSRKLELIPASGMNAADIRAKILENGYQLVVIDYLQLISARGGNRYEQVTNISIDLHNMAQSLGVTIVALSQLSRSEDERTPKNSDLRESGQLEQDADIIIMLKLEKQTEPAGPRKVFVTKNKEGELFMSLLAFDGKHQTFSKLQRTGDTVRKYVAEGKKARQKNRMEAQTSGQLALLPSDYPDPF